jgi:tetratricopeptide (TPR) repeat protein
MQEKGRIMAEQLLSVNRNSAGLPEVAAAGAPNERSLGLLFNFYNRMGRSDWVLAVCDSLLAKDIRTKLVLRNRGLALQKLERSRESEASYRDALEIDPADPQTHQWLGDLLDDLGRYKEAYELTEEGVIANPDIGISFVNLAIQLLNRNYVRDDAGTVVGPVRPAAALQAAVPLLVEATKRGGPQVRQTVVAILVGRGAMKEAEAIAQGGVPDGEYDNRALQFILSKVGP